MLERIVSGGQSGCDLAAWKAAQRFGIPTGGWCTRGFLTEQGPRPEYAVEFGAKECPEGTSTASRYRIRSRWNVRDSDGTLIFDAVGSRATENAGEDADEFGKPMWCIRLVRLGRNLWSPYIRSQAPDSAAWITKYGIRVLNIGGNRESKVPGIGAFVESYLAEVFHLLGHVEV